MESKTTSTESNIEKRTDIAEVIMQTAHRVRQASLQPGVTRNLANMWRTGLDIPNDKMLYVVISKFAASLDKLDALIAEDETFSENSRQFFMVTTSGLRQSIQPENFGNGFDGYKNTYSADMIDRLCFASDVLKKKYPIRQLTESQISALAEMITECLVIVSDLEIEERWRAILTEKLMDFSDLLTNIDYLGSEKIIESAGGFAGYVVTLGRQHQQVSDSLGSITAKMLEFAGHVSLVWDAITPIRNILTSPDVLSQLISR